MDRTKLGEDAYRAFQAHGYDAKATRVEISKKSGRGW